MKFPRIYQQGGASLLTTVILAVVLLGIVGGLTTLSVRELRQSSNVEQSNRALSAAESYVQTLASEISNEAAPHDRAACNAAKGAATANAAINIGPNLDVTCATVTTGASEETMGYIKRDSSFKIDLTGGLNSAGQPVRVASMSIDWDKQGDSTRPGLLGLPSSYTGLSSGNWSYPAALELTYVWRPSSGAINPLNTADSYGLPMQRYVVKPGGSVKLGASTPPPLWVATSCGSSLNATGYHCSTKSPDRIDLRTLANVDDNSFTFKLTSRYNDTHFRLKFYDKDNNVIKMPQPYATIDVTARSNNLYRRVIAQKDLDSSASAGLLDYVIFSGGNICKDLQVGADHKPANGGAGKNTCDGQDGGSE